MLIDCRQCTSRHKSARSHKPNYVWRFGSVVLSIHSLTSFFYTCTARLSVFHFVHFFVSWFICHFFPQSCILTHKASTPTAGSGSPETLVNFNASHAFRMLHINPLVTWDHLKMDVKCGPSTFSMHMCIHMVIPMTIVYLNDAHYPMSDFCDDSMIRSTSGSRSYRRTRTSSFERCQANEAMPPNPQHASSHLLRN